MNKQLKDIALTIGHNVGNVPTWNTESICATAAELKKLAYSLEKTRHEINEELATKMAEWQARAKVFNVLGDFCAIKYNREAGEFRSDRL